MAYDKTKDPNKGNNYTSGRRRGSRATKGKAIVPSDTVDLTSYASGIVVTAAGNLKFIPAGNDDADAITITGAAVGYVPPYQVRRVFATGTTASVASIDN